MTAKTPSLLVGLSGRKRAGKDTFADVLVTDHGYARASFADAVRDAALRLDPVIYVDPVNSEPIRLSEVVEDIGWERAKDEHAEVRRTLQRLGTDVVRSINPDTWVDAAFAALDTEEAVVFTDVRFPNEADAIKERGGIIVRIERRGIDDGDSHASETAMDDYSVDCVIHDNLDEPRTVEQLRDTAHAFAAQAPLAALMIALEKVVD
ncbi:deoxynucleoside monophosphate kinase [Arthrobacter phage CallinAllBarbz]|uniref:Deoxynucleoside monophosphate kinase n=1 Tax=Arthrobacter phage CallinAllBarbz TaxID=3077790 RepID=A0AA96KAW2_9CAUD|nr:deoxynucleoside monophosphate kinase [Arthrobacter phage CallinAllBarbz]